MISGDSRNPSNMWYPNIQNLNLLRKKTPWHASQCWKLIDKSMITDFALKIILRNFLYFQFLPWSMTRLIKEFWSVIFDYSNIHVFEFLKYSRYFLHALWWRFNTAVELNEKHIFELSCLILAYHTGADSLSCLVLVPALHLVQGFGYRTSVFLILRGFENPWCWVKPGILAQNRGDNYFMMIIRSFFLRTESIKGACCISTFRPFLTLKICLTP